MCRPLLLRQVAAPSARPAERRGGALADHRTTITELVTGLGTLGYDDLDAALAARPPEMVSVSPEQWGLLDELHRGGRFRQEFAAAWRNGAAFLAARDGLRGRRPIVVEWRGNQRQPGDEPVPADLRIDHVFLVSCKYLSRIVTNASPSTLFDRLLAGGHGTRSGDWYAEATPDAYQALYDQVVAHLAEPVETTEPAQPPTPARENLVEELATKRPDPSRDSAAAAEAWPSKVGDLTASQRLALKAALGGRWPAALRPAACTFAAAVAEASADRWRAALAGADAEKALWRLLRIGGAPYFVLGASDAGSLRLRIGTAWDWRQHFRIVDVRIEAPDRTREQPVVDWAVTVAGRRSAAERTVAGHVEVRWSHGKFAQFPEAKVYLDTPHAQVPGYWPLA